MSHNLEWIEIGKVEVMPQNDDVNDVDDDEEAREERADSSSQCSYNQEGMWYQMKFLSCYFQLWFLFITHIQYTQYTAKFSMVFTYSLFLSFLGGFGWMNEWIFIMRER